MRQYADTSFLVSAYLPDIHSSRVKQYLSGTSDSLLFSPLHFLEIRNAFQLAVFRKRITAQQALAFWKNVRSDIRSGGLERVDLDWPRTYRLAFWHARRQTATLGTRSFDILHVASAQVLGRLKFLSFDSRQRSLASVVGLQVGP